jgi:chemotaxis methyl-accepting protein methylase
LAIVWKELTDTLGQAPALHIVATDGDAENVQRGRQGVFPSGSLKEVPAPLKDRWFRGERGGRRMRIDANLQKDIEWRMHDLLDDPPVYRFHLVLLRNSLLTYYQGVRLQSAFDRIAGHIVPGGLLIVGSHERLPETAFHFQRDPFCPWVYKMCGLKVHSEKHARKSPYPEGSSVQIIDRILLPEY